MKHIFYLLLFILFSGATLSAQCEFAMDEVDEFDSLRIIASQPITIGYMVPSKFKAPDGNNTMIDEGKAIFSFSEGDSINAFFLILGIMESGFTPALPGTTVLLKLSNGEILGLLNAPDRGQFDEQTNMRLYTHTSVIPTDYYPALADFYVEKIRIKYKKQKRTITLTNDQQKALQEVIRCVGEAVNFYPTKP